MLENFNSDKKKENISLKSLALKIFLFLGLIVVCYNLFFCSSNDSVNLVDIEKKEEQCNTGSQERYRVIRQTLDEAGKKMR